MSEFKNICNEIGFIEVINGKLDKLQVKANKKVWTFRFIFENVLEPNITENFKNLLKSHVFNKFSSVTDCNIYISYRDTFLRRDLVEDYYNFSLKELMKTSPRVGSLIDYEASFSDNEIRISCPNGDVDYIKDVLLVLGNYFEVLGLVVKLDVNQIEGISQVEKVIEQQKQIQRESLEKQKKVLLSTGYIKGKPYKIFDLPRDYREAEEFGKQRVELLGRVISVEFRELRKGYSLITACFTDLSDSITIKRLFNENDKVDLFQKIIKVGEYIKVGGTIKFDEYEKDVIFEFENVEQVIEVDNEVFLEKERVELLLHTNMTTMNGITKISDYVKEAKRRNQRAIAVTDLNTVQSFPDFAYAVKGTGILPIYGAQISSINDKDVFITKGENQNDLSDITFTVFDIETTGLSVYRNDIIEIAAIKVKNGVEVERYATFVKVNYALSHFTQNLTQISDSDLIDAPSESLVMTRFKSFIKGTVLVAHNARFDCDFIKEKFKKYNLYDNDFTYLDTLTLARVLFFDDNKLKFYNLKALSKYLKIEQSNHHRAIYDTEATVRIFNSLMKTVKEKSIFKFNDLNSMIELSKKHLYNFTNPVTFLIKNLAGKKDLYKLLSIGNTVKFHKQTRVLYSDIEKYRSNLLVGSSCVNGEIFEFALNKSYEDLLERIDFFDYIEIQPPSVYANLKELSHYELGDFEIHDIIRRIIKASKEKNKLIVVTGDVYHLTEDQKEVRDIYLKTPVVGGGFNRLASVKDIASAHYRKTSDIIDEFKFLNNPELVQEIVVDNTHLIADMIEEYPLFPKELFKINDDFLKDFGIESSDEAVKSIVYGNAKSIYSDNLPPIIEDRIERELTSILKQGFGNLYLISHLLVKNSNDAGYIVGSRGSVGSSIVATFMKITEVNPLPPHYVCPNCKCSIFKGEENLDPALESLVSIVNEIDSGFDLEKVPCPKCGTTLIGEGNDTPFEVFLGFKGDKVPDIDLNFSGEYQATAHEELRKWFGVERSFRAGTISTIKDKKAYGFVKKHTENRMPQPRRAEINRLTLQMSGVRNSTGQHPGGIVVVPSYTDIYEVTPIQYPADDTTSNWRTTHFDYHSFENNLFKFDVLGHDDPTIIAYLMNHVKENPEEFPFTDVRQIPLVDKDVLELFNSTKSLGVTPDQIMSEVGTYAVPEFGTQFVREMLKDTKPKTFNELVMISGLSHGTNVWLNNAKDLVSGTTEYGKIEFKDVIACRDDIMVYLMYQGLNPEDSFSIMETVRKGKTLSAEQIKVMEDNKVPKWYIWSCGQIQYMFPKAHAIAYVTMSLRIAWFKVHAPIYFYSIYFSKRASAHYADVYIGGYTKIKEKIMELKEKERMKSITKLEEKAMSVLQVALEMTARGYTFSNVDLKKSDAENYVISEDKKSIYIPFTAIDGLGASVAQNIIIERQLDDFSSIEDFKNRSNCNNSVMEILRELGVFKNYKEDDKPTQLSFFS